MIRRPPNDPKPDKRTAQTARPHAVYGGKKAKSTPPGQERSMEDLALQILANRAVDSVARRVATELLQHQPSRRQNVEEESELFAHMLAEIQDEISNDQIAAQEIGHTLSRLDEGIAREQAAMDALLSRLRAIRIAA
jgi:hypothetical protein